MWMRIFQLLLFLLGGAASMIGYSPDSPRDQMSIHMAIGAACGFLLATWGTWLINRLRHGPKVEGWWAMIVRTLHETF